MRSRAVSLPASCCRAEPVLAAAQLRATLQVFEMLRVSSMHRPDVPH